MALLACGLTEGYRGTEFENGGPNAKRGRPSTRKAQPLALERPIMKFSLSITKPEITELSRRSGIPIPRELLLQLETRETILLASDLQLSNMSQFQLAKAILSSLVGLGSALSYGEVS